MLAEWLNPSFTISKYDILPILTYRYWTNAYLIFTQDIDFFLLSSNIPNSKISNFISTQYLFLVWMKNGTIDWFILFHFLNFILSSQIKHFQVPIFTACVNDFIMHSEPYRCNISLELWWIKYSLSRMSWTIQVINFNIIVHSNNKLWFWFTDFNFIWYWVWKVNGLSCDTCTCSRIPKSNSPIIWPTCKSQCHTILDLYKFY